MSSPLFQLTEHNHESIFHQLIQQSDSTICLPNQLNNNQIFAQYFSNIRDAKNVFIGKCKSLKCNWRSQLSSAQLATIRRILDKLSGKDNGEITIVFEEGGNLSFPNYVRKTLQDWGFITKKNEEMMWESSVEDWDVFLYVLIGPSNYESLGRPQSTEDWEFKIKELSLKNLNKKINDFLEIHLQRVADAKRRDQIRKVLIFLERSNWTDDIPSIDSQVMPIDENNKTLRNLYKINGLCKEARSLGLEVPHSLLKKMSDYLIKKKSSLHSDEYAVLIYCLDQLSQKSPTQHRFKFDNNTTVSVPDFIFDSLIKFYSPCMNDQNPRMLTASQEFTSPPSILNGLEIDREVGSSTIEVSNSSFFSEKTFLSLIQILIGYQLSQLHKIEIQPLDFSNAVITLFIHALELDLTELKYQCARLLDKKREDSISFVRQEDAKLLYWKLAILRLDETRSRPEKRDLTYTQEFGCIYGETTPSIVQYFFERLHHTLKFYSLISDESPTNRLIEANGDLFNEQFKLPIFHLIDFPTSRL